MNTGEIGAIAGRAMYVAMEIAVPLLLLCLIIGVIVSIFQATTQIHEQSLAFVPKLVAMIAMILILGSWMIGQLETFTREVFNKIAAM